MKNLRPWLLVGLTAPALLALALPADEIHFSPASGLSLVKTFEVEVTSNVDDMELTVDGNEMPAPPVESETSQTNTIRVTDLFVQTEGSRVTILERTFDEIVGVTNVDMQHPMQGPVEEEFNSGSELEGTTVVFKWNEENEGFDATFAEESADEDEALLEGLVQSMDLAEFLPGEAVSVDDSWSFPASALLAVLAPGGNLSLVPEESDSAIDSSSGLDFSRQLGEMDGDCTATLTGLKNGENGTIAMIRLSIEASSTNDITELMAEAIQASEEQMKAAGMEQEIQSADASFEFELEGELLWNIDGGHFLSLELSGTTEVVLDLALSMTAMGKAMDVENAIYSSGEITLNATASAPTE